MFQKFKYFFKDLLKKYFSIKSGPKYFSISRSNSSRSSAIKSDSLDLSVVLRLEVGLSDCKALSSPEV